MTPLMVLIATVAVGIEVGWEPLDGGGHEYTIQIEPSQLRTLQHNDIISEVPPQVHVRQYRITLGSGRLSQIDGDASDPFEKRHGQPKLATDFDALFDHTSPAADGPREDQAAAPGLPLAGDVPANFPEPAKRAQHLADESAGANADPQDHITEMPPSLPDDTSRPWLPFLIAAVLLSCSLGGNLYLGWIAWDARARYRNIVAKFRAAPAT